jgi:hypothetical protein
VITLSGLTGTYQIREADYVDTDSSGNWTALVNGTITYRSAITDTEANYERSHACYEIGSPATNDGYKLVYANWKDTGQWLPGTAGQYPRFGLWLRASQTGAVVKIDILHGGGTISTTVTITTANKWQFKEIDISGANGQTCTEVQVYSAAVTALTIWIARTWWVNQSRVDAVSGTYTDERHQLTGAVNINSSTERCYVNCVAQTYYNIGSNTQKSIMLQSTSGYDTYQSDSIISIIKSTSINLFSGDDWNQILAGGLGYGFYSSSTSEKTLNYVKFFGGTVSVSSQVNANFNKFQYVNFYNSELDGLSKAAGSWDFVKAQQLKFVGGSYAINTYLGNYFIIKDSTISLVNKPTKDVYLQWSSEVSWLNSGTSLNNAVSVYGQPLWKGLRTYSRIDFVTSPITSGVKVFGVSVLTDESGNVLTCKGLTDGSGLVTLYGLSSINDGTSNHSFSDVSNKWTFYFIDTASNTVLATYAADITSGIGTPSSPVSVSLSSSTTKFRFDGEVFS